APDLYPLSLHDALPILPGASGVEVTRALREDSDPHLRDVPVVLITAQSGAENTAVGFAAGVTDYLTKPFRPAHVRARVRAWLLRSEEHTSELQSRGHLV